MPRGMQEVKREALLLVGRAMASDTKKGRKIRREVGC